MASRRAGVHVSAANTASRARCVSRSDPSQTSTVSGRPAASWKNSPLEKAARSLTCVRSMSPPTRSSWPPIRAVRQSSAPAPTVRVRSPSCTRPSDPVIAPVMSSSRAGRSLVGRVERVPCRTSIDADTCVAPPSGLCHDPREARVLAVRRFSRPGAASGRSANGTSFVVEGRSTKPTTLADRPFAPQTIRPCTRGVLVTAPGPPARVSSPYSPARPKPRWDVSGPLNTIAARRLRPGRSRSARRGFASSVSSGSVSWLQALPPPTTSTMPRREAPPARVTTSRTAPEPSRSSAPTPARTAALVAAGRMNDVHARPSSGSLRSRASTRRGVPTSAAAPKAEPRATPGARARMAAEASARSSGSAASGGCARTKATPGACRRIATSPIAPSPG